MIRPLPHRVFFRPLEEDRGREKYLRLKGSAPRGPGELRCSGSAKRSVPKGGARAAVSQALGWVRVRFLRALRVDPQGVGA